VSLTLHALSLSHSALSELPLGPPLSAPLITPLSLCVWAAQVLVAQDAAMDAAFLPSLTSALTAANLERLSMAEFTALPPVAELAQ
jgi:hypothetical protein